jgi:hypothetical protein
VRGRIAWIAAALSLAGCSAGRDLAMVERAAEQFHMRMNRERFQAIYATSGAQLKSRTRGPALTSLLSAVHRKLGRFEGGKTIRWRENVSAEGHFFAIDYAARYEKADATESFVFRIDGQDARLEGYRINSNALTLN